MAGKRQNPKNYDGLEWTGRLAKNIVSNVFADIQKSFDANPQNVFAVFLGLLNEKIRPLVEPVFFSKGVLTVKVKNATLLSILSSQEKGHLVQNLGKLLPSAEIQNIVFQSG